MNDRTTTQDRRQDLEAFANSGTAPAPANAGVRQLAATADRVFGAQNVAVYRDEARILQKLTALAAAAGDDWFYRYPVKKKGGGQDFIEGPSIKLANDVARIYGNCDVDCRVVDAGDSWSLYARFTDFETGYSLTRPFQQRKSQRAMNTDADRALDIAFQIGVSKAIRNVVCNALQTFSDFAFEQAKNSLVDKIGKDIAAWRVRTIEGLGRVPVDIARVEKVLGRASRDWLAPDVAKVIAMMKAIADGMATVDESFPPLDAKPAADDTAGTADEMDRFAGQDGAGTARRKTQPPRRSVRMTLRRVRPLRRRLLRTRSPNRRYPKRPRPQLPIQSRRPRRTRPNGSRTSTPG